jgi:hypothetical protein
MSKLDFLIAIACVAAVIVAFCAIAIVNRLDQLIGILMGAAADKVEVEQERLPKSRLSE